jgi:hypothetical protein
MSAETEIDVPDRRPQTEVIDWMEMVQKNIGFDHHEINPLCRSGACEYVKIPLDGDSVGVPPTRQ